VALHRKRWPCIEVFVHIEMFLGPPPRAKKRGSRASLSPRLLPFNLYCGEPRSSHSSSLSPVASAPSSSSRRIVDPAFAPRYA
jgi:hypothetical protein